MHDTIAKPLALPTTVVAIKDSASVLLIATHEVPETRIVAI